MGWRIKEQKNPSKTRRFLLQIIAGDGLEAFLGDDERTFGKGKSLITSAPSQRLDRLSRHSPSTERSVRATTPGRTGLHLHRLCKQATQALAAEALVTLGLGLLINADTNPLECFSLREVEQKQFHQCFTFGFP